MLDRNISELHKSIYFHLKASKTEFFFDGNKRTSRLMAYGHLLQNGLMPFALEETMLLNYNNGMLSYYETDKMDAVLILLKDSQKEWQSKYEALL